MSGEGQRESDNLASAGFSSNDVAAWQAQKRQDLSAAGFNGEEVDDYFGTKAPNDKAIADTFHTLIKPAAEAAAGDGETPAKPFGFSDALKAGWQQSVSGLALREKMPDLSLPADNTWYQRLAFNTAGLAGDLPAMVGGFIIGGGTGGAAGGAAGAETGPGAAITGTAGAIVVGTAGAFAMPTLMRETMMDAYRNGEFHTPAEFLQRAGGIFIDTAKSYVTGAATAGAGVIAKPALAAVGAKGAVATAGTVSAEVGAMVTTSKALEGQLPSAQDFVDAAVVIGAFKTVPFLAGKVQEGVDTVKAHTPEITNTLRNIYAKTGKMPAEVVKDAGQDPTIMQDVITGKGDIPEAYKAEGHSFFQEQKIREDEPNLPTGYTRLYRGESLDPNKGAMGVNLNDGTGLWYTPDRGKAEKYGDQIRYVDVPNTREGLGMWAYGDGKGDERVWGDPNNPPPSKILVARAEVPAKGTLEEAQKNILDKIQVGAKDEKAPLNFDTFYTKVIDDMNPLKLAVNAMADGKELPTADNPYALARLTRGAYGKADQFLTQSPYDFKTYKNVGKSLEDIVTPFKEDLNGVRAYLIAKRTQELESRGITSGFDINDANKVVAESGSKYGSVQKDLVDYQNHLTRYLRDAGILSKDAYDAMNDANKQYVPFYRVMDSEGITTSGSAGKGIGTKNPLKNIKGSERDVIDPIESIIKNTYTYLALADRNEVAQKYVDLANKAEDPSQFAKKVNPPIKGVTVKDEEMTKFLQDNGIKEVPDDLLTVFRAARQPLDDNQIAVFNKGKREVYELPGDVASVFKAADRESANWLFRIIAAPSKMFRAGVTLSPDFFPRNLIRDQFDALINSRSGFIPLLDTVRGAASMVKQDDAYQNWLKSGGANATMVTLDRNYIQNNVIKLNEETGFADHAWNMIKSPFDALRIVSELAENATRLGEFKKAMGEDSSKASIQNAGFQSREVTLDFARIGSKMQATNMLIAFWNAQVQGIDRLARVFKEDPVGTSAKIGAAITLPSVLLWWNNHDDPRYKDIPDWQKDRFWIVMTKDHIYRIPKPHEAGILFGSGIERFLDYMKGSDPKSVEHYTADVLSSFAPGFVPTVAQPVIEQFANKSLFTGGRIIPSSTENLLPEVQYQPYTTELAKSLGKLVGTLPPLNKPGSIASPSIIENYIRGWSGGLGMYTVQLADAGLRKAGVLPDPVMPAGTLADTPFIKAFVVRYPSAGAQPIQDFYDSYDSHKQVLDTVQYMAKQGDFASAVKLAQLHPESMVRMGAIKEGLSNAQKFVQMVTKNPAMSPTDKRQLIDATYYQMINMAKSGNELMRSIDQTMAK